MSNRRSISFIEKHFDKHFEFIINKINESSIPLARLSDKALNELIYPIVHLIDFEFKGDSKFLSNKTIHEIHTMYSDWYKLHENKFTTLNYIEKNKIILDYRENGFGYYWVDLNCYYSYEMLFRLHNCARVNSYQNFLELREYNVDGYNYSRVVVVTWSNFINQIKGDYNKKPDMIYKDYIYDLFLNYKELKGFKIFFKNDTNFTHMDLSNDELNNLRIKRPEFFYLM
jgi:hypothetical protein